MTDDNGLDRVVGYLRMRADVDVPEGLSERALSKATATERPVRPLLGAPVRLVSLAATAVAVVLVVALVANPPTRVPISSPSGTTAAVVASTPRPTSTGLPQTSPTEPATPSARPIPVPTDPTPVPAPATQPAASPAPTPPLSSPATFDGTFPSSVLGIPVLSVAQARALEESGTIDGEVIAVGGYYFSFLPHCYSNGSDLSGLEPWCFIAAFADNPHDAQLCRTTNHGNGTSCRTEGLTPPNYVPLLSGGEFGGAANGLPVVPIVVLGHVGDALSMVCDFNTMPDCRQRFVSDRVVWANGQFLPDTPPEISDDQGVALQPRMTADDVSAAVGRRTIVRASPVQAKYVADADPRWNMTGEQIMWIVAYLADDQGGAGQSRRVDTALIDDASGQVVDSHSLGFDPDYSPVRLFVKAERHDLDEQHNLPDDLVFFYSVSSASGTALHSGAIFGPGIGGADVFTIGPSKPLLLSQGDYDIGGWLAPYGEGVTGDASRMCSTKAFVTPGDTGLVASFAGTQPCTFTTFAPT